MVTRGVRRAAFGQRHWDIQRAPTVRTWQCIAVSVPHSLWFYLAVIALPTMVCAIGMALLQQRHRAGPVVGLGIAVVTVVGSAVAARTVGLTHYGVARILVEWSIPLGTSIILPLGWLIWRRADALRWRLVGSTVCAAVGACIGFMSGFLSACGLLGDCL